MRRMLIVLAVVAVTLVFVPAAQAKRHYPDAKTWKYALGSLTLIDMHWNGDATKVPWAAGGPFAGFNQTTQCWGRYARALAKHEQALHRLAQTGKLDKATQRLLRPFLPPDVPQAY